MRIGSFLTGFPRELTYNPSYHYFMVSQYLWAYAFFPVVLGGRYCFFMLVCLNPLPCPSRERRVRALVSCAPYQG
jgi:hypothetical protein